jgi:hypothetical protein
MPERNIDPTRMGEDWEGNNIAVSCPACGKVFIVSGRIHHGKRDCPKCGKSTGTLMGGKKSGGTATVKW